VSRGRDRERRANSDHAHEAQRRPAPSSSRSNPTSAPPPFSSTDAPKPRRLRPAFSSVQTQPRRGAFFFEPGVCTAGAASPGFEPGVSDPSRAAFRFEPGVSAAAAPSNPAESATLGRDRRSPATRFHEASMHDDLLDLTDLERTWLAAYVEEQTEPYGALLPAPALAAMREALFETLAIHDGTLAMIKRLAPVKIVEESGKHPVDASLADAPIEAIEAAPPAQRPREHRRHAQALAEEVNMASSLDDNMTRRR